MSENKEEIALTINDINEAIKPLYNFINVNAAVMSAILDILDEKIESIEVNEETKGYMITKTVVLLPDGTIKKAIFKPEVKEESKIIMPKS